MIGFFGAWIGLAVIAAVVTFGVSVAAYRFIDVTFTQFVILLVAPAAQAAVLTWPAGLAARLANAFRHAWQHPLGAPVIMLDGLLLLAGLAAWSSSAFGFGASITIQPTWIAAKAVAAACLCIAGTRGATLVARIGLSGVALLIAAHAQFGVLERVFLEIDARAQMIPEVFLRLGWYGGIYVVAVAALIRLGRRLPDDAGTWISAAVAMSVPGLMLVACAMFNNPGVLPPWRGLALLTASASMTSLLLGVVVWSRPAGPRS